MRGLSGLGVGLTALFVAVAPGQAVAQEIPRVAQTNVNSWWTLALETPVRGKVGVRYETVARRSDFLNTWFQLQFQPAVTYQFSSNVQGSLGYIWIRNGRYGENPVERPYLEQRVYAELRVREPLRKVELEHRFRFDHRYLQNFTSGSNYFWRRQERVRYQARMNFPLTPARDGGRQWLIVGGGEILLHVGPNHGHSTFDQNRVFAGLAYKFNPGNRLETVYLDQYRHLRDGAIAETNHTLRVQLTLDLHLFKR